MKTSSLTSTNPPTAVRMPRKISASFKAVHGLFEAVAGGGEALRAGGVADGVHRSSGVLVLDRLALGKERFARLVAHLPGINRRQPPGAVEPLDRAPFREHRAGALGGGQLLVLGR